MSLTPAEIEILSERYSKAMFELASEKKSVKSIGKDLSVLSDLLDKSEDFSSVITDPTISKSEISSLFEKISTKYKLSDITKNFLLLLSEERRCGLLAKIIAKFDAAVKVSENISVVELTTAKEVSKKISEKVKKELEKALGNEVELVQSVDPEIIGGIKLKVGSLLFDDSIENKLQKLQNEIAA